MAPEPSRIGRRREKDDHGSEPVSRPREEAREAEIRCSSAGRHIIKYELAEKSAARMVHALRKKKIILFVYIGN